jgi:hypothetical protein
MRPGRFSFQAVMERESIMMERGRAAVEGTNEMKLQIVS